jgi:serine protease AprX
VIVRTGLVVLRSCEVLMPFRSTTPRGTARRWRPLTAGVLTFALGAALASTALAPRGVRPGPRPTSPSTAESPVQFLGGGKAGWGGTDPAYTPSQIADVIHARSLWNAGYRGQGIDVAVIDTGVVPVAGLAGKTLNGPDLSFERGNATLRSLDTFGHGTHMASLIAGAADATDSKGVPVAGTWSGIAPSARVVSLKVATADGAADVSQVIAAVNWVVEHRSDPGMNIRVLNLSFGTNSAQSYLLDPLAHAVEQAWKAGIVVVAAAGNDGATATRLDDPAVDPLVLAVGAESPGTDPAVKHDTVADFSSRGSTTRHADLLAPGASVLGLRDPGSAIDLAYPSAVVGERFFKGSGTSQAAAVTSGAVALLLSKRPTLTPDQVKKLLTSTAAPIDGADAVSQGAGVLDVNKAAGASVPALSTQLAVATGLGSLEAARGGAHVQLGSTELTGEKDAFGAAWKPAIWTAAITGLTSWTGSAAPSGTSWSTWAWLGSSLADKTTTQTTTSSGGWTGRMWSGRMWSGGTWSATLWTGRMWSSTLW